MTYDKGWLEQVLNQNQLRVSPEVMERLSMYVAALCAWNQKVNLISRTDEQNIWNKHILSSLSLLTKFSIHEGSSLLDLGTGGGLPGIPLAILLPTSKFTLVDSIQKKINAVQEIIGELGLGNAMAICGRAEILSRQDEYQNKFDHVIARAVGPIKDIVQWGQHFLRKMPGPVSIDRTPNRAGKRTTLPHGTLLLLKGGEMTQEINQASVKLKPRYLEAFPLMFEGSESAELFDKKLVIIQP